MEYPERNMSTGNNFAYIPEEHEREKASNSYLMSIIAGIGGLPLPIINLIATVVFYAGNRKGTWFVRWHCTQALLSQASLLIINTTGFVWILMVLLKSHPVTDNFIAYVIAMIIFNVIEFIATIDGAVRTRNGKHVSWYFYGTLTNMICKEKI